MPASVGAPPDPLTIVRETPRSLSHLQGLPADERARIRAAAAAVRDGDAAAPDMAGRARGLLRLLRQADAQPPPRPAETDAPRQERLFAQDREPGGEVGPAFDAGSTARIAGSPLDRGMVAVIDQPEMAAQAARELAAYATTTTAAPPRRALVYGRASADDAERWSTPTVAVQPGAWLVMDSDGIRHALRRHCAGGRRRRTWRWRR